MIEPTSEDFPLIFRNDDGTRSKQAEEARKSPDGQHFLMSYELLKRDATELFAYIEPATQNLQAFSHRIYELFLRTSTEVEANFKHLFERNGKTFSKPDRGDIKEYRRAEATALLSQYEVRLNGWAIPLMEPFQSFSRENTGNCSPAWYRDYNKVKHNRWKNFPLANLGNAIESLAGLFVVLTVQYGKSIDNSMRYSNGSYKVVHGLFSISRFPNWKAFPIPRREHSGETP